MLIKVIHYNGVKRTVKRNPKTLTEVKKIIVDLFGQVLADCSIAYFDSDEELITLVDQQDWEVCLEEMSLLKKNNVVLSLLPDRLNLAQGSKLEQSMPISEINQNTPFFTKFQQKSIRNSLIEFSSMSEASEEDEADDPKAINNSEIIFKTEFNDIDFEEKIQDREDDRLIIEEFLKIDEQAMIKQFEAIIHDGSQEALQKRLAEEEEDKKVIEEFLRTNEELALKEFEIHYQNEQNKEKRRIQELAKKELQESFKKLESDLILEEFVKDAQSSCLSKVEQELLVEDFVKEEQKKSFLQLQGSLENQEKRKVNVQKMKKQRRKRERRRIMLENQQREKKREEELRLWLIAEKKRKAKLEEKARLEDEKIWQEIEMNSKKFDENQKLKNETEGKENFVEKKAIFESPKDLAQKRANYRKKLSQKAKLTLEQSHLKKLINKTIQAKLSQNTVLSVEEMTFTLSSNPTLQSEINKLLRSKAKENKNKRFNSFKEHTASNVIHHGVACDGCGSFPIVGVRYKSLVRLNYDLCESCEKVTDIKDPMVRFREEAKFGHRGVDMFWGKIVSLFRGMKNIETNAPIKSRTCANKAPPMAKTLKKSCFHKGTKKIAKKVKILTATPLAKITKKQEIDSPRLKVNKKKLSKKLAEISNMFNQVPIEELKKFLEKPEIVKISDTDELYNKVIDRFL